MADLRRVYIDTCCFVDLVKVALGSTINADKENDVWHIKNPQQRIIIGAVIKFDAIASHVS